VKNSTNFIFFQSKRVPLCCFVKTTKLFFVRSITLQFDFCVLFKIYNNGVFFHVLHFIFYVFLKNNTNCVFINVLGLNFCGYEKSTREWLFFHVLHFNSIFFCFCFCEYQVQRSYLPILDIIFCDLVKTNTNFIFFDVKYFNFCGFDKIRKLVYFPCITLQFDFSVFVKIYRNGVFSMYYTSLLVVFWKLIQSVFFFQVFVLNFCGYEKTTKEYFYFPCITLQFNFFVFVLVEIFNNGVFSMYYTSFFVVFCKRIQISFFYIYLF
jgi:hypothetical protein